VRYGSRPGYGFRSGYGVRSGYGFGRMPGDIAYRGRRTRVYAPIMSSLLLSLVLSVGLTLLLNAAVR
jgi:hypothetical protein